MLGCCRRHDLKEWFLSFLQVAKRAKMGDQKQYQVTTGSGLLFSRNETCYYDGDLEGPGSTCMTRLLQNHEEWMSRYDPNILNSKLVDW